MKRYRDPTVPKDYPGSQRRRRSRLSPAFLCVVFLLLALIAAFFLTRLHCPPNRGQAPTVPPGTQAVAAATASLTPTAFRQESPSAPEPPTPLPLLVNNTHPLPEGYNTASFVCLDDYGDGLFTVKNSGTYAAPEAAEALTAMLAAAHRDGLTTWQISEGYRSVEAQQAIWDEKYEKYRTVNGLSEKKALEAVERRVARPGHSEHHTGLALDVTVPGASFRQTPQAEWLAEHCTEYGFVIRYTEEKERITGITAEPWHIRFVGVEAARMMKENNWCLEEYVQIMQKKL